MKNAWNWTKRNIVAVLGGVVALLVGVMVYSSNKRKTGSLKDEIKLAKAEGQLKALNVRKEKAVELMGEKVVIAAGLKGDLAKTKKKILEIREREPIVEDMTDEELDSRLSDLGY